MPESSSEDELQKIIGEAKDRQWEEEEIKRRQKLLQEIKEKESKKEKGGK